MERVGKGVGALKPGWSTWNKRYTPEYINKQPQLQWIPVRIGELQAELATVTKGAAAELSAATGACRRQANGG